jgi:hypothetical protein
MATGKSGTVSFCIRDDARPANYRIVGTMGMAIDPELWLVLPD